MTVSGTLRTALLAAACGVASTFVPAPPLCTPMGASVQEKSSGFSRTPPAAIPQVRAGRDPSTQTLDRIPSASLSGEQEFCCAVSLSCKATLAPTKPVSCSSPCHFNALDPLPVMTALSCAPCSTACTSCAPPCDPALILHTPTGDEDGGDALGPVGCLPDIKEVVSEEDAARALHMFQMFDSFRQRLSAEEKFAKVSCMRASTARTNDSDGSNDMHFCGRTRRPPLRVLTPS